MSEMTILREKLDKILDAAFPERIQARGVLAPEWSHSADIQIAEKGPGLAAEGSLDSERTGPAK